MTPSCPGPPAPPARGAVPVRPGTWLRARLADDSGNAPVEFIGWVLVLVVPVLYLLVTLSQVQATSFAVASAADAAARVLAVETGPEAQAHARTAVGLALQDQHVDTNPMSALTTSCSVKGCDEGVVVHVEAGVDLPGLAVLGLGRDVVVLDASRRVTLAGAGQ